MSKRFLADIFVPNHSHGLFVDAQVIRHALAPEVVRIIKFPWQAVGAAESCNSALLRFDAESDVAIFIERPFRHPSLRNYARRILVPNPEWLSPEDEECCRDVVTEIWHKTMFSESMLAGLFPEKVNLCTGFTSLDAGEMVSSYARFAHLAGKSQTRYTQELLDLWIANPSWPSLTLQSYARKLTVPEQILSGNLRILMGFLSDAEIRYQMLYGGIHLCLSQVDGFGHHINEGRAVGALVLVLDAPPMNELIDSASGILVPVADSVNQGRGCRFLATIQDIESSLLRVMAMDEESRRLLGESGRERYLLDRDRFRRVIRSALLA